MNKEKQLTPVMQALKEHREVIKSFNERIERKPSNLNQLILKRQVCQYAIEVLESILPAEEKAMIEFTKDWSIEKNRRYVTPKGLFYETFKTEEG